MPDFEEINASCIEGGNENKFASSLQLIKTICEEENIPYSIGGATALGFYAKPRTTADVDVFIFQSSKRAFLDKLTELEIPYVKEDDAHYVIPCSESNGTNIDLLIGSSIDEAHGEILFNPNKSLIYGVNMNIARPEGLLWNYLVSITDNTDAAKRAQHTADAINLIRATQINFVELYDKLEEYDPALISLLGRLIEDSSTRGSYQQTREAMKKRLQGGEDE